MRTLGTLAFASALALHVSARAADNNEFELANKTDSNISAELRVQGAKPVKKELKKFELWKTKFNRANLPTLYIKTSDSNKVSYEFEVEAHQSLKVVFEKNWKTKEPELKPKFASNNVTKDSIRQAEAPEEDEPVDEPADEPADEPEEEPSKTPSKAEPAEETSTLKVKVEELFDVEASMSEAEKAQKILNIKFLSDVRVAMGEQEAKSPEDLKRAEATVTAAYKAQAQVWKPDAKLNYRVVAVMKSHDVTDPKDQKALAAKGLALIESTYAAVKKNFK